MGFLLRLLSHVIGLSVAAWALDGIEFVGPSYGSEELNAKALPVIGVALILTLVTTILRPLVRAFTLPIVLLTFGLFLLVINAWMLILTDKIAGQIGIHFVVSGFITALFGSMIITATSYVTDTVVRNK